MAKSGFPMSCAAIALAVLGLAACAASRDAPQAASSQARCAPGQALPAGITERQIESGGRVRAYRIVVPASYSGQEPAPLVFNLHATSDTPAAQAALSGAARIHPLGAIIVEPTGSVSVGEGFGWNVPNNPDGADEVRFLEDVLGAVSAEMCIDETRVYAMGWSGGARMASELACMRPHRVAAIAAIGGLRRPEGDDGVCAEGPAVSVIAFHGQRDGVNPYVVGDAAPSPRWTYGVDEALRRWSLALHCAAPAAEQVTASIERIAFQRCRNGAELVLYRSGPMGHTWPGTAIAMLPELGTVEQDIDATALSLDFFAAHTRERAS